MSLATKFPSEEGWLDATLKKRNKGVPFNIQDTIRMITFDDPAKYQLGFFSDSDDQCRIIIKKKEEQHKKTNHA